MYLVIKREKSEHLKHKVHKMKELACDVLECLEEAYSESHETESRERTRMSEREEPRRKREDYYDDDDYYERDEARGRGRGMRGRY